MIKPISLPPGSPVMIGAPAHPLTPDITSAITRAVASVPDIMEAHLPNVFAVGVMEAPAQVLVLVFSTIANKDQVLSALGDALASEMPPGFALDVWPIHGRSDTLDDVRSAGCQLPLPPHGAPIRPGTYSS
jgi:hypothetical protein